MARAKKTTESVVEEVVTENVAPVSFLKDNEMVVVKNGKECIQWTDELGVTFVRPL